MKSFLVLLSMTLFTYADMGQIINLELFDNKNPAIITDIEDELNHVVVDIAFTHKEKEVTQQRLNTQQGQNYDAAIKTYRRFNDVVLYFKAFHTIKGVQSDPTHTVADISKSFSAADIALATTIFDDLDLGISYHYEISDNNSTLRHAQFGLRYVDDVNLAAVVGMQATQDDTKVKDTQLFYRLGLSRGETSSALFDMSFTYRPQSTTAAENGLLANSQPKTYEGVMQLQGDENFSRGGLRFEYKKEFALLSGDPDIYTRTLRYHRGMKVQREENSFSIFYISYKRAEQANTLDHTFELGVSLRGFYD
jgi:hypothetical protein